MATRRAFGVGAAAKRTASPATPSRRMPGRSATRFATIRKT